MCHEMHQLVLPSIPPQACLQAEGMDMLHTKPPCIVKIFSSMMAATGMQLNVSVKVFQIRILYLAKKGLQDLTNAGGFNAASAPHVKEQAVESLILRVTRWLIQSPRG